MWPLGDYNRLVFEIKRRENPDISVTFGILIADYDQHQCREYILNYIDRFNYKSGRYINFYLPGYLEENFYDGNKIIAIGNKEYYFNRQVYINFLTHLENDFSIKFPYNPVLILLEYYKGNFRFSKRIIIKLDENGSQIKQTGELFEEIFNIAQKEVDINDFSNKLQRIKMKNNLFDTIITCIDNRFLTAIYDENKNIKEYRLAKKLWNWLINIAESLDSIRNKI